MWDSTEYETTTVIVIWNTILSTSVTELETFNSTSITVYCKVCCYLLMCTAVQAAPKVFCRSIPSFNCIKLWEFYKLHVLPSYPDPGIIRCYQNHLTMIIAYLRILFLASLWPGNIWTYFEAIENLTALGG